MNTKTKARMLRHVNLLSSVENRLWRAIHASEKLKHPRAEDLRAAAQMRVIVERISDCRNGIIHPAQTEIPLS